MKKPWFFDALVGSHAGPTREQPSEHPGKFGIELWNPEEYKKSKNWKSYNDSLHEKKYWELIYTKTYLNTALSNKVDTSTLTSYYTKTQIDTTFSNYYLQTHIDNNCYNNTYIDALTHAQIKYNNNYVDLEYLDFADTTITTGSNSNEYVLT